MLYILHTVHVAKLQTVHTNVSQDNQCSRILCYPSFLNSLKLLAKASNSEFTGILWNAVMFRGWIQNWIWIHVTIKNLINKTKPELWFVKRSQRWKKLKVCNSKIFKITLNYETFVPHQPVHPNKTIQLLKPSTICLMFLITYLASLHFIGYNLFMVFECVFVPTY